MLQTLTLSQSVKSTTRYYTVQTVLRITLKVVPHLGIAPRQLCTFYLELICRNTSLRFQAPRSSKAAPVAVLMPEYEGPLFNPFASSQQTDLDGVVFVDCNATIGSQSAVHASNADIMPSEAGVAPDISSADQLHTAHTALDRVAQPPCVQSSASVDVSPLVLGQPDLCFFDASDSLDYVASLAEALARLCKRASEDGQAQSAHQAAKDCQQQHVQEAAANTLSLSAAAATTDADALAVDSPQSSANLEANLNTACSMSADDAAETVSDDGMAMVDALMTSEVQHAAVDQVLDDLLDEVAASLQPMQSSLPADNAADTISDDLTATINALVRSEAQHDAVDQVVDELLAQVAAPFQPAQSSMPADTSGMVSPIVNLLANSVLPQHAAVDQVLEDLLDEVSTPLQPVQSSTPADSAADIVSDDIAAREVALVSSQVQHAAVDQVVDEVSAHVQSVQSSMPADTSGRVRPKVSMLATSFAPQQADSLPAVPAPDSCYVSSTTHSQPLPPVATASQRSSAELLSVVPSSSIISGKENMPVVEARQVNKEVKQVVGAMGRGRGRVCCLDRGIFQEMAQALPTEPSSQVVYLTMVPLPQR